MPPAGDCTRSRREKCRTFYGQQYPRQTVKSFLPPPCMACPSSIGHYGESADSSLGGGLTRSAREQTGISQPLTLPLGTRPSGNTERWPYRGARWIIRQARFGSFWIPFHLGVIMGLMVCLVLADGQANPTFLWQVGDLWGYPAPTLGSRLHPRSVVGWWCVVFCG